jgi:GH18 family chitinase
MRAGKKVAALILVLMLASAFSLFAEKRIVTYFPEWGIYAGHNYYYPEFVPFTKITHLNYGFIEIKKIAAGNFQLGIIDAWPARTRRMAPTTRPPEWATSAS